MKAISNHFNINGIRTVSVGLIKIDQDKCIDFNVIRWKFSSDKFIQLIKEHYNTTLILVNNYSTTALGDVTDL